MADISDCENAIKAILVNAAYPTGTANPSSVVDGAGLTKKVKVYRGWPEPRGLDEDMSAKTVVVSIYPMGVEINATRYNKDWQTLPKPAATVSLTPNNSAVTVAGTASTPQNVAVVLKLVGGAVDEGEVELEDSTGIIVQEDGSPFTLETFDLQLRTGFGFSYAVQANDTPTSIATALATLISQHTPATSNGAVVTVPAAYKIIPRPGPYCKAIQEIKRQKRNIMVSIWVSEPAVRDIAGPIFDIALAQNEFLTMPDGTAARLIYVSSPISDKIEKENIWRRDLIYSVEYGTTITIDAPTVTVFETNLNQFGTDQLITTIEI